MFLLQIEVMTDSAPKQLPPYGLRMPPALKDRVQAAATQNSRSMNAEIVATLEEKYPPSDSLDRATAAVVDLLTSRVPRAALVSDFEDRIREILRENIPPVGIHPDDMPLKK